MLIYEQRSMGAPAGGGGTAPANFTPSAGISAVGTFGNLSTTFGLHKAAGGFGTAPTIAFYASFRGGTNGADVGLTDPEVGAIAATFAGTGSSQKPYYVGAAGIDGDSCANTLIPAVAVNNSWLQMQLAISAASQILCFRHYKIDVTTGSQAGTNQKDMWWGQGTHFADGTGNDFYPGAAQGYFGNSGTVQYNGGSSSSDNPGNDPPNSGYWPRDDWTSHLYGVKPHTALALGALADTYTVIANATYGQYRDTSTNKVSFWNSNGNGWDGVLLPGDYQDQGAGHVGDPPHATHQYWNNVLIQTGSNAWKLFLLGNASTFNTCTRLFPLVPSSWSDTDVVFRAFNTGVSLVGWYVYYLTGAASTAVTMGFGT